MISTVLEKLRSVLPPDWSIREGKQSSKAPDLRLEIRAPDGRSAVMPFQMKGELEARHVAGVVADLGCALEEDGPAFVAAPYLSERTRELLERAGVSYGDATGNVRLRLREPGLFVQTTGAQENPRRVEERLVSLRGRGAGRAVRALCDFRPPYGIRELAERSGASAPTLSRVATLLEKEAIVRREDGGIVDVDWRAAITRWAKDYALTESNGAETYLDPRGVASLSRRLTALKKRYVVTGALAANLVAPIAPPRLAAIYLEDVGAAAKALQLRPAESGANVLALRPFDDVVFDRTWRKDGVTCAAMSQVAVDLLTSPGRGPAEAEELLQWMEKNEDAWRS